MKRSCQVTHAWCLSTHPQHTNQSAQSRQRMHRPSCLPSAYPDEIRVPWAGCLGCLPSVRVFSLATSWSRWTSPCPWCSLQRLHRRPLCQLLRHLALVHREAGDVHVRVVLRGAHLLPRVLVWTLLPRLRCLHVALVILRLVPCLFGRVLVSNL